MLYCSSSSGEHFDRRARELRQASKSIVEGIIHPRQSSVQKKIAETTTLTHL